MRQLDQSQVADDWTCFFKESGRKYFAGKKNIRDDYI
jgi:hypothetical protein